MPEGYTTEMNIRVYDDSTGNYVEIAPDADALGLIELRLVEDDSIKQRICMTQEQARKFVAAQQFYFDMVAAVPNAE